MTMIPPRRTMRFGRGHAFHRLVEVAVEGVSAVRRHDEIEGRVDHAYRGGLHVRTGGIVGLGQRAGKDGGHLTGPVDGDVEGEVRRGQRGGGPHEVVHRVARPRHEGGPGIGNAARVVCLQDGRGGGEPRADRLRPAAETGEEVRLDEAGHDAQVGLDVVALQQHRRPVHLAYGNVRRARRVVVDDGVAPDDLGPDELLHLGWRGLAVGPGGAQQRDALVGHPAASQLGQQRRQHGAVRHRARQVGEDDGDARRARRQLLQWPPGPRPSQCRGDRRCLVRQTGLVHRDDDLGAVRDLDRGPVAAVGQLDAHGQGASGLAPGSDSVAASTATATWSTRGRSPR